jgi:ferredoxin
MTDMTLYQQLAADLDFGESKMIPKMFAFIADEDEAKLMLAASPPATVAEISEKTGFDEEKVKSMLDSLFIKGLIFKSKKPDAIEMLKMCEEEGLVHCVENKYGFGHVICNCDNVGCGNWGHDRAYVKKFTAPSRFKASVDPELCTSCETCVDRCFFDAASMEGPDGTAIIGADKCMGCGICVPTCPGDAITYEEVRQKEFIPE